MRPGPAAAVAAVLLATAVAACSIGPGESGSGTVVLTVTRDYGGTRLLHDSERTIPSGETVMRLLQRNAKVETRYGGRFVNAIDGLRSGVEPARLVLLRERDRGRRRAPPSAISRSGDRVWWDYHDWSGVMRVPAVVGSFPEPFLHGSEGKRFPVRIDCAQDAERRLQRAVADRLERGRHQRRARRAIGAPAGQGGAAGRGRASGARFAHDAAAEQIEQGPDESGVFARFSAPGGAAATSSICSIRRARSHRARSGRRRAWWPRRGSRSSSRPGS